MDYTMKTMGQLLSYIADLEQRVADLEKSETEYRCLEEALRERDRQFLNLFEKTRISLCRISPEVRFFCLDPAAVTIKGYSSYEELVYSVPDMGSQLYARPEESEEAMCRLREEGILRDLEIKFNSREGIFIWVLLNAMAVHDKDGNVIYYDGISQDITDRKKHEEELRYTERAFIELENVFRGLAEKSLAGIYLIQDELFQYVNSRFAVTFGYRKKDVEGKMGPEKLVFPEDWPFLKDKINEKISIERTSSHDKLRGITKDNKVIDIEVFCTRIIYKGKPALVGTSLDITEYRLANETIKKMEQDLAIKSRNLEELNIALKVLLQQMETDKKALEEKFVSNVKTLVLPYTEKIQKHRLDSEQKAYLDIMQTNLKNVISPFLNMVRHFNFTPKEIEVVSLIRDKKSTKEIAEIMGVSACAIDAHRNKIRKKLGLNNKKTNLQSYLQGLK
jgi:PAS domain S-box-containing protein